MNQLLETILEKDKEEAEFDALFQPATAEELETRRARLVEEALEKGKCTQNSDGIWSCESYVDLSDLYLRKLPVKFKEARGSFDCSHNQLETLEGAPEYVNMNFYCSGNHLTSLEGAPEWVGWRFYCNNNQLQTLEGAPRRVGENFDCSYNQLKTLEGGPEYVGGYFDCSHNQLRTLEGAPKHVKWGLHCNNNPTSADELKKTVDRPYLK